MKMTQLEEAEALQAKFKKWWKVATAKDSRYLVDFGCQHAFKAGYRAAERKSNQAAKRGKGKS